VRSLSANHSATTLRLLLTTCDFLFSSYLTGLFLYKLSIIYKMGQRHDSDHHNRTIKSLATRIIICYIISIFSAWSFIFGVVIFAGVGFFIPFDALINTICIVQSFDMKEDFSNYIWYICTTSSLFPKISMKQISNVLVTSKSNTPNDEEPSPRNDCESQ